MRNPPETLPAAANIRWLIRRDMDEVLAIEQASFPAPHAWTEEDFLCALRSRKIIGKVVECEGRVVAFVIYEAGVSRFSIVKLAVHPDYRRRRIGSRIVQHLKDKLDPKRRNEIVLEISESNLAGQLFFRTRGFVALGVVKGRYENSDDDCYPMRYTLGAASPFSPKNRISQYLADGE